MAEGQGWMNNCWCSPLRGCSFNSHSKIEDFNFDEPMVGSHDVLTLLKMTPSGIILKNGGTGIRTPGPGKGLTVFKTCPKKHKKAEI